jgi:hypothetical protein
MLVIDFVIVLFIALLISFLLTGVLGRQWPGQTGVRSFFIIFFLILLLATWAFGIWMRPFGPMFYGIYWLPFVIIGLIFGLLLASFFQQRQPRTRREVLEQADAREEAKVVLGATFWTLLIVLVAVIIVHYLV